MIDNETMRSILSRRSFKIFDGRPIEAEKLETILNAGLYAPTGMNGQPWHFTVIQSREMLDKVAAAREALPPPCPPPGVKLPDGPAAFANPMRNAPVLVLVSARNHPTAMQDCCLATENMFIAAASMGIMSGWDHATTKDLFAEGRNAELKAELIPEGYTLYTAFFLGYTNTEPKDRGPRKGTIAIV